MRELLVLWDLDGTLVSAPGLGDRLYRKVFRTLFGRDLGPIAAMAGRTDRAIMLETLAMAGIGPPEAHVGPFLETLARHIRSFDGSLDGIRAVRALPGSAQAISALATADPAVTGIRVHQSVLTGNIRPGAELKLRLAGLTDHLDLGIGAYGEAHTVRADLVAVARSAADALDPASPSPYAGSSTVLVGDTPLDVEAALATGARAVGVATGSFPVAELTAAGAHAVLKDLTDTSAVVAAVTG